jgi:hypothetical protein
VRSTALTHHVTYGHHRDELRTAITQQHNEIATCKYTSILLHLNSSYDL